jgi:hypothetical protein
MLALIRLHIRPLSLRIRTRTARAVLASVAALAIFVGHFHCELDPIGGTTGGWI